MTQAPATPPSTPPTTPPGPRPARRSRLVPAGLVALSLVPVVAGTLRLSELSGLALVGPDVLPDDTHLAAAPLVVHIVGASVYTVLGAFQFGGRRPPARHRLMGRILLPCGLAAALSGLWLTVFYPRRPVDVELLTVLRIGFGSAMAAALLLGLAAVLRRDHRAHRAWMTRGYALGLGAGSQAVIVSLWAAVAGQPAGNTRALLLGAGWAVNLAVAEWLIRRRRARRAVSA
ncbi:DUF2306 domain-containing protein [Actinomadura sp. ATCC 31491]|uniref:DUF2306 domain-containing protein n=1 Tax=Actinomadura luzonensis TaxID=2805427 RepID=A0ABT0FUA6_9ACTN|nr:DUF2306 domain-containing protein [Actinomadura luzonensis]MCK2215849.1 DUF2306 domain-containing protein [Actinomadura luzonensis]